MGWVGCGDGSPFVVPDGGVVGQNSAPSWPLVARRTRRRKVALCPAGRRIDIRAAAGFPGFRFQPARYQQLTMHNVPCIYFLTFTFARVLLCLVVFWPVLSSKGQKTIPQATTCCGVLSINRLGDLPTFRRSSRFRAMRSGQRSSGQDSFSLGKLTGCPRQTFDCLRVNPFCV